MRPRSRYSNPWSPNHALCVKPWMPANSPARLPTTTTTRAPSRQYESIFCPRGSRPEIMGARKMPAARYEVETQKIDSCTCHVRTMLNGRNLPRSIPKKLCRSAR